MVVNKERVKKKEEIGKLSPTHSELEEPVQFKVIDGEDVQALAIKEDELKKLSKHRLIADEKKEGVLVRKKNKNAFPTIEVKVAKLAPDKPLKPIDVTDNLGIRFDKSGHCVPHSILGNVEDFLQESVNNGKSIELPLNNDSNDQPKADVYIKPVRNPSGKSYAGDYGEKALNNWSVKMNERKITQLNISSKQT